MSRPEGRGHVTGLLAPYAEGFREELLGQGYTQGSAAHQIHLMAHLSRLLEAQELEPTALDERVISQFAAARRADGYAAQRSARALMPLLGYLRALGVAAPPRMPEPQGPGDRLIGRFAGYLARERCPAADSIRSYTGVARRFLAEAGTGGDVGGLTVADVTGFARRECGRRGVASAKATVTGLRALLRPNAIMPVTLPRVRVLPVPLPLVLSTGLMVPPRRCQIPAPAPDVAAVAVRSPSWRGAAVRRRRRRAGGQREAVPASDARRAGVTGVRRVPAAGSRLVLAVRSRRRRSAGADAGRVPGP